MTNKKDKETFPSIIFEVSIISLALYGVYNLLKKKKKMK